MMKIFTTILLAYILLPCIGLAQVKFTSSIQNEKVELKRDKEKKSIYLLKVVSNNTASDPIMKDYTVQVEADPTKSTLPLGSFAVDFKETSLANLGKEYTFYLLINPDKEKDREREIYLNLKIKSSKDPDLTKIKNDSLSPGLLIKVKPIVEDTVIQQYNYLAYIGTNFDLVDGIKAKNLFFATNIYKMPKPREESLHDVGFNLTLYGNRTLTTTENLGTKRYDATYVKIPNQDSAFVRVNEGNLVESRVSDNLGAAFSPMFNLWNLASVKRTFQLLYAPQVEFIWRRYTTTTSYTEIRTVDSTKVIRWRGSDVFNLTPPTDIRHSNSYDVNLGLLGAFLSHETKNLSLRFQVAGGYSFRYTSQRVASPRGSVETKFTRQGDCFFGARLWITEAVSGITLGAEISNRIFRNYEPFYNVTLSKALSFGNIGSIFSPITAR